MCMFRGRRPEQMEQFLRDKRNEQRRDNITGTRERCKHLEKHLQEETLTWTTQQTKEGPQAYKEMENQVREREQDNEERRHERMLRYPHWEGIPRRTDRAGQGTQQQVLELTERIETMAGHMEELKARQMDNTQAALKNGSDFFKYKIQAAGRNHAVSEELKRLRGARPTSH